MSYELTCTGCSFEKTVAGNTDEVYDVIESYQTNCGDDPMVHLVEFVKTD
ncbi:hypothetical protein [Haloprofundus salinisoli]|nr:hypothetical protein [Haloprofundus salinisoli]